MNPQAGRLLDGLDQWSAAPAAPGDAWNRLRVMLERHAGSEFGREYGFDSIGSPEEFREAMAPMSYEDHRKWIERAASGEKGVLACDEVLGFERTSGTSAGAKWIPITEGLREEFARGLAGWFCGWRKRRPEVFEGRGYWAISPPGMKAETTAGGMQVGMTSDAAYFPDELGARLAEWLVIPDLGGEAETFFEETAECLLAIPDLSVVSVWSPTFLLGIDAAVRRLNGDRTWRDLWPGLALVSCWADASSAPWIPVLHQRLGGIPIEGKGLLATEGITSIPDGVDGSARLAGECHWHEFLDGAGSFTYLADLRPGRTYEVLFTTSGGLFRYRSGDLVRVTQIGDDGMPQLRFIGRSGAVSDLVGEKLGEEQVLAAMAKCGGRGVVVSNPDLPGYDVWLEDCVAAAGIEKFLRRNPYFDQALALGQLAPLRIRRLPVDWYLRLTRCLALHRGCRIGDVKLSALLTEIDPKEVESWLD